MIICLLHPRHTSIGSRIPQEHLPPYGLLSIAGPLIDAGHEVSLVNADRLDLTVVETASAVEKSCADAILIGHSGSSSVHPEVETLLPELRRSNPTAQIIYGGVFPSYHWKEVLENCPDVDVIVRGEGEVTAKLLMERLAEGRSITDLPGIAFRDTSGARATRPAAMIADLDAHRIGWELINHADYSYWGGRRAVILQFSRGCPHLCTYCGQRGFWTRWRHRNPEAFAAEIARLHREEGVDLINLADENPTSSRRMWKRFLDAMITQNVPVTIIGSTRASDIVRDADILHLYKKAGVLRFLLGLDGTSDQTLDAVRKGSDRTIDAQAIRLLRNHGMIGLCTFCVGFEEERDSDYLAIMRQLLRYDPDQVMSVYATPHQWSPFYNEVRHRRVIQPDTRLWDYKHQVLETRHVPPWRVFLWVKLIELRLQARPTALWRTFLHPDPEMRHAMQWYARMGRKVFFREVLQFLFREKRLKTGPRLEEFMADGFMQIDENMHEKPSGRHRAGTGRHIPELPNRS